MSAALSARSAHGGSTPGLDADRAVGGAGAGITRRVQPAARQPVLPMHWQPPPVPAAVGLLSQASSGLAAAAQEKEPLARFSEAYLSALRAAAALLAARGRPHRGRAKPASVWVLLESTAPEHAEWASYFAANSTTHAAAQAGITRRVTTAAADDLVLRAGQFIELVRRSVHRGG